MLFYAIVILYSLPVAPFFWMPSPPRIQLVFYGQLPPELPPAYVAVDPAIDRNAPLVGPVNPQPYQP